MNVRMRPPSASADETGASRLLSPGICRTLPHALCWGLLAALAAGCAGPRASTTSLGTASGAPLKIDDLRPAAILSQKELSRISKKIPAEFRGDVIAAESLGRIVYAHERLAATAAALVAPGGHASFASAPAGWVTERTHDGLRVAFVVKSDDSLRVAAEVTQKNGESKPQVRRFQEPRALTPTESLLWHARQLAFTAPIKPCSSQYNPVVVPLEARGKNLFYVFLLPVAADANVMFFGGYYRITISSDATRILDTHAFTHSCIQLRRNPKAVAAGLTEVISDSPTTPQVYASLAYEIPVEVATSDNGILWKIKDGAIFYAGSVNQG